MKFDVVHDNYEIYLAAPARCGRCQRHFQAGERVRMVCAAPVERLLPRQDYALMNSRQINQSWEHENPDHCTEPR